MDVLPRRRRPTISAVVGPLRSPELIFLIVFRTLADESLRDSPDIADRGRRGLEIEHHSGKYRHCASGISFFTRPTHPYVSGGSGRTPPIALGRCRNLLPLPISQRCPP